MRMRSRYSFVVGAWLQRHLKDLGQMQSAPLRTLGDLLAATEAVGDDEPVSRGSANGGKKFELADCHGDVVLFALEAEGSGHAATSRGRALEIDPEAVQK